MGSINYLTRPRTCFSVPRPSAIGFASGECRAGKAGWESGLMGVVV